MSPLSLATRPEARGRSAADPTDEPVTILIVDDEPTVRLIAQRVLEMRGYRSLTADGGEEAAAICENFAGAIDLVLTDIMMPDLNGGELSKRVAELRPRAKLLFMSGLECDAASEHGVSATRDRYLQKPFTPSALRGIVQSVLG
jgi:two-component system, cell cycle sensor histidine kinase and response regulator CckA